MFTVRLRLPGLRPDAQITIRSAQEDDWDRHLPGLFDDDDWRFDLDEDRYPEGFRFKFVLDFSRWMLGDDIVLAPKAGDDVVFGAGVAFPPPEGLEVENPSIAQRFFAPVLDEDRVWDVIVIGSGMGGGIVADRLSGLELDVLVLEAGSYLFPTHSGNLPRQHQLGRFDKHVWGLWDEFMVQACVPVDDSPYGGGQGFNLGGRSIFWGGLAPRATGVELEGWPADVRRDLLDGDYARAEEALNAGPQPSSPYQQRVKALLDQTMADFVHFDAPVAVQYRAATAGGIPTGLFSTADLLLESRLTAGTAGRDNLTVNLNHAAVRIETAGGQATAVIAEDLISTRARRFQGRVIVLAAGTVESAKLAQLSGLPDPRGLVGQGITDHPIFFTHFRIPAGTPYHDPGDSSKTLSRRRDPTGAGHPYNLVLELGADFNQGRYLDDALLAEHLRDRGAWTLGEVVFLLAAPLVEDNRLDPVAASFMKPALHMQRWPVPGGLRAEIEDVKGRLLRSLGAEPLPGGNLDAIEAPLGGVAHEVGTLRMGEPGAGVVGPDLRWDGLDNLYVCDLSVLPTSPGANPSLTLAALAIRLADAIDRRP